MGSNPTQANFKESFSGEYRIYQFIPLHWLPQENLNWNKRGDRRIALK